MGNLILNFLQEQGILIVMGLMVLEGIVHQWVASRRYRRLRAGIQSLTAAYGQGDVHRQAGQATYGKGTEAVAESGKEISAGTRKRGRRTSRRQEVGRSAPEIVTDLERSGGRHQRYDLETDNLVAGTVHSQNTETASRGRSQETQQSQQELDAQLLYLKQSLDRIAAGRDQKLEEEPREHRKLTPEQEAIIADILREYLS